MKAIVVREFGAPDVMKVEDVPKPEPSLGQILVAISAAGVNPVDTYIRSGQYAKKPPLPYTPGMDGSGVVKSLGQGVTKFPVGAKVYLAGSVSGTYAEYALCDESQAHSLPDRISFGQGAAIGVPYGVAYRALFHRALAQPSEICSHSWWNRRGRGGCNPIGARPRLEGHRNCWYGRWPQFSG